MVCIVQGLGDGFAPGPLPPVTRAVRCSAGIAATGLWLVRPWFLCLAHNGPHCLKMILEREYRDRLAYGPGPISPVRNGLLQPWGEGGLILIGDLAPARHPSGAETDARRPAGSAYTLQVLGLGAGFRSSVPDSAMPSCPRVKAWRLQTIAGRFPGIRRCRRSCVPGSPWNRLGDGFIAHGPNSLLG